MNDIETINQLLSDQEKSDLLCPRVGIEPGIYSVSTLYPDLYREMHMALAWKVHIWAIHNSNDKFFKKYHKWWRTMKPFYNEDAQRAWLDKILSLAIEAGLVELENERVSSVLSINHPEAF
jgi:hypothetical protein